MSLRPKKNTESLYLNYISESHTRDAVYKAKQLSAIMRTETEVGQGQEPRSFSHKSCLLESYDINYDDFEPQRYPLKSHMRAFRDVHKEEKSREREHFVGEIYMRRF